MANPFLVLGGVAVGVITAGIGVLQVPGWIDSANDSAVRNDLSQVALSQEAAYTVAATYLTEGELVDGEIASGPSAGEQTGVKFQQSSGVELNVFKNAASDAWAAIGLSKSGHVFVRTSEATTTFTSDEKDFAAAIDEINGELPTGYEVTGTSFDSATITVPAS